MRPRASESVTSQNGESPVHTPHKVLPILSPSFFIKYGETLSKMREFAFTKRIKRLRSAIKTKCSEISSIDLQVFQLFEDFCLAIHGNKTIETLNLSSVSMSALMFSRLMQALSQHSSLKELNFSLNNLSNLSLKYICRTLKENKNIKILKLFSVNIIRENLRDLTELLTYNHSLETINLNFSEMGSESLKDYCEALLKSKTLSKIKLAKCGFDLNSLKALGFFLLKSHGSRTIKKLDLSFNKISSNEIKILDEYIRKWDFCKCLKKKNSMVFLESLKLSSNRIRDKEATKALNDFIQGIESLSKLYLAKNWLENQDLLDLVPTFKRVSVKLDLSRNNFNDEIPGNFDFLMNLKELNISHNRIRKKVCEKLADFLRKSKNIEILDISDNGIRSSGFERICEGLVENQSLKCLKSNRNDIESLKEFSDLKSRISLKTLELSGNPLVLEALDYLFSGPCALQTVVLNDISLGEIIRTTIQKDGSISKASVHRKAPLKVINEEEVKMVFSIKLEPPLQEIEPERSNFETPKNDLLKLNLTSCDASKNFNHDDSFESSPSSRDRNQKKKLASLENSVVLMKSLKKTLDFIHVKELSLKNSPFLAPPILKALKAHGKSTSIRKLDISSCSGLSNKDMKNLSRAIQTLTHLEHLALNQLSLGNLQPLYFNQIMNALTESRSIQILELNSNNLMGVFPELLNCLKQIYTLSELYVKCNRFPNESYECLGDFVLKAERLTILDLSDNSLGFLTVSNLCQKINENYNSRLLALYLRNTTLNITCLYPISELIAKTQTLKILDLSSNDFLSKDLNALLFQDKVSVLKTLNLSNYSVDDHQANNLIKFLSKTKVLESINISHSNFLAWDLQRVLKYLAEVESLKSLEFHNCPLGDKEIAEFFLRMRRNKNDLRELRLERLDMFKEKSTESLWRYLSETQSLEILQICQVPDCLNGLDNIIRALVAKNDLTTVIFKTMGISKALIPSLAALLENKELKELTLDDNKLDLGDMETLILKGSCVKVLSLSGNNLIRNNWTNKLFEGLERSHLQELRLNRSLININIETLRSFSKALSKNSPLKRLELDFNAFSDENLMIISEIFTSQESRLLYFSVKGNKFTTLGLAILFRNLIKNKTLEYLDISENMSAKEQPFFCQHLQKFFSHNKFLKVIDVSNTCLKTQNYNRPLLSILEKNNQIFFLNSHWEGIKSALALKILERLFAVFLDSKSYNVSIPTNLKSINFSNSRLDDEFCVKFAEFLPYLTDIEIVDISKNPKITLIGLKFIYVSLASLKSFHDHQIKRIYFESCNHRNILNDGLASSLVDWARYKETNNFIKKRFFNFVDWLFSRLMVRANRFLYGSDFEDFTGRIKRTTILLICGCNFILIGCLSFIFPIILNINGHYYYSFAAFFVYTVFSVGLEIIFWLKSREALSKVAIYEKDWQIENLRNDVLNLVAGALARYDLYSDTLFVLITMCAGFRRIFYSSLFFLLIKLSVKIFQFVKTYTKLAMAIRNQKSHVIIWNLVAKMTVVMDFLLIGDILDRYCPEDIPQTIIQLIYLATKDYLSPVNEDFKKRLEGFCKDVQGTTSESKEGTLLLEMWLWFSVTRLIISLFVSFYSFASIRQSYLEQSDFDERIESQRLLNSIEGNQKKKSVMKTDFNSLKAATELTDNVRARMNLITSHYLEHFVKIEKKRNLGAGVLSPNRGEEGVEDLLNLAVNSVESHDNERFHDENKDLDYMDSRVRLKKYFENEAL